VFGLDLDMDLIWIRRLTLGVLEAFGRTPHVSSVLLQLKLMVKVPFNSQSLRISECKAPKT